MSEPTMAEHADRDAFEWLRKYALDTGNPFAAHALVLWHDAATKPATITRGRLDSAKRRALNIFDDWVNVTGVVGMHTGYYYELQSLIKDAVECGTQAACGVREPLESEMKDVPPEAAQVLREDFWKLV